METEGAGRMANELNGTPVDPFAWGPGTAIRDRRLRAIVLGLDIGFIHDRSALSVVRCYEQRRILSKSEVYDRSSHWPPTLRERAQSSSAVSRAIRDAMRYGRESYYELIELAQAPERTTNDELARQVCQLLLEIMQELGDDARREEELHPSDESDEELQLRLESRPVKLRVHVDKTGLGLPSYLEIQKALRSFDPRLQAVRAYPIGITAGDKEYSEMRESVSKSRLVLNVPRLLRQKLLRISDRTPLLQQFLKQAEDFGQTNRGEGRSPQYGNQTASGYDDLVLSVALALAYDPCLHRVQEGATLFPGANPAAFADSPNTTQARREAEEREAAEDAALEDRFDPQYFPAAENARWHRERQEQGLEPPDDSVI